MNRRNLLLPCLVLVAGTLTPPSAMPASEPLYNEKADAASDIAAAIREAGRDHRNIVLVFGAEWCGPCHALDRQMHTVEIAPLMKNFVVVKVDMGQFDKNLDLGPKYRVPLKSIPAMAILDSQGEPLYGSAVDFDDYKAMRAFFEQWTPKAIRAPEVKQ